MEAEVKAILIEVCGGGDTESTIGSLPGLISELYNGTPLKDAVVKLIAERRKEYKKEP